MRKSAKVVLGLATIWPVIYMIFFFVVLILDSLASMFREGANEEGAVPFWLAIILPLHLLTMLLIVLLLVFYITHVFRNDRVDKDKKALWAVVLFLGNAIAMPVYWYLYVWRHKEQSS